MTTDLRQWLETMAAEAAAARDAEPPREWSNGWHDGNRAAYHAVLTWLGDHPTTADRDRLRETMASALHATAPRNHPPAPMLRSICIGSEPHMDQARQIVDILAALAQPPAPAATAGYDFCPICGWSSPDDGKTLHVHLAEQHVAPAATERCAWPGCDELQASHVHDHGDTDDRHVGSVGCHPFTPAPAATADTLRTKKAAALVEGMGDLFDDGALAADLLELEREAFAAARAEPLDVEALAKALHPYYHDAALSRCYSRPGMEGETVCGHAAARLAAAYAEARRRDV